MGEGGRGVCGGGQVGVGGREEGYTGLEFRRLTSKEHEPMITGRGDSTTQNARNVPTGMQQTTTAKLCYPRSTNRCMHRKQPHTNNEDT